MWESYSQLTNSIIFQREVYHQPDFCWERVYYAGIFKTRCDQLFDSMLTVSWCGKANSPWRIHGAGIYANIYH